MTSIAHHSLRKRGADAGGMVASYWQSLCDNVLNSDVDGRILSQLCLGLDHPLLQKKIYIIKNLSRNFKNIEVMKCKYSN